MSTLMCFHCYYTYTVQHFCHCTRCTETALSQSVSRIVNSLHKRSHEHSYSNCVFGRLLQAFLTSAYSTSVNSAGDLPPWLSRLAISGRGAVKAWLAIRQGVGSYPTPAGMSSQVSA